MSNKFLKIQKGVRLEPQSSSSASQKGSLEVLDSTSELYYHNGSTSAIVANASNTVTLSNKTLASPVLTGTLTTSGENLALTAAATYDLVLTTSSGGEVNLNGLIISDAGSLTLPASASLEVENLTVTKHTKLSSANNANDGAIAITTPITRLTGATTVTDFTGGSAGEVITVINAKGSSFSIANNSNIVTGTGSAITLENGASLMLVRDGTSSEWRVIGGTGSGGLTGKALTDSHIIVGNGSNLSAALDTTLLGDILVNVANGMTVKPGSVLDVEIHRHDTDFFIQTSGDMEDPKNISILTNFDNTTGQTGNITLSTEGFPTSGTKGDIILNGAKVDVSSNKIVNLANGTANTDAVNKGQLDLKVNLAGATMGSNADLTFQGGGEVLGLPAVPSVDDAASSKKFVDDQITGLSSVYIPLTQKGANNGVATLDAGGKIPATQLPSTVMEFKGTFDPATATFTDGAGNAGDVWLASAAGSYNAGSGSITYAIGDWAVHNGSIFEKSLNSNAVVSVNGLTGIVVLTTDYIVEGAGSLYFNNARAQYAVGEMVTNSYKVSLTYVDSTPSLTADIIAGSLVNTDISGSADIEESKLDLDYSTSSLNTAIGDAQTDIDDLVTLSGVAANSEDLGVFSGSTIPDDQTVKQALQALETEVETKADAVSGDLLADTTFNLDTASTPTDVTGLAFTNARRSFVAQVTVNRVTDGKFEMFHIYGIRLASSWEITVQGVGEETGVDFSITSGGQVQYVSDGTGFTAGGSIKFRAQVVDA
jgi:hypothetical protein